MDTVLVTGGAGFIGSNLSQALLNKGYKVRILDDLTTGNLENIEPIKEKIELVNADIRNLESVRESMKDVRFVLHQAALPSVPRSIKDPITTNAVNVNGTLNVLLAAKDSGVKRVVYASSSSVYGESKTLPKVETMTPSPLSPYAVSKLTGEHYCRVFHGVYGFEAVCLRYFNVYGPNQDPSSQYAAVIPKFITSIMDNERPVIYGDGEQTRDFTFVKDVVNANILALEAPNAPGGIFNIASGKRITINGLVSMLNDIMDKDIEPKHTKERPGDIKHSLADITRAKKTLGYSPAYTIKDGLKETADYYANR